MTAVSLHAPKHRCLNMAHQVAFKYWWNINLVLCNWALLRLFKTSDITASRSYKLSLPLPSIPSSHMSPKNPLSNIRNSSNSAFKLTHFIRWLYHQPIIQMSSHIMVWQTHFHQTCMKLFSPTSSLLRQRDVCVFGGCMCAQAAGNTKRKKNHLSKFRVLLNQTLYTCHKKDRKKGKEGEREGGNESSFVQKIVLVSVMLLNNSSLKR